MRKSETGRKKRVSQRPPVALDWQGCQGESVLPWSRHLRIPEKELQEVTAGRWIQELVRRMVRGLEQSW